MHKLVVEYHQPADADAFEAGYRERHVPLVNDLTGLERFTLTWPRGGERGPHLVAELWFASEEAFGAAMASPAMAAAGADAETYDVARRAMYAGPVEDVG